MTAPKRLYSKEEFPRRGDALVESKVRPNLTAADQDRFVAIDNETGEYELNSVDHYRLPNHGAYGDGVDRRGRTRG